MRRTPLLLALGLVAGGACAATPVPSTQPLAPPPTPAYTPLPPPAPERVIRDALAPIAPQESLIELVPSGAVWAAILRSHALQPMREAFATDPGLKGELATFLDATVGIDLTAVDAVVAWSLSADADSFALVLHLSPAAPGEARPVPHLRGEKLGAVGGVAVVRLQPHVVAAVLPSTVVIGTEREVAAAIALGNHETSPVGPGSPLAPLAALDPRGVDIVAGAHLPSFRQPDVTEAVQSFGLSVATLAFDQAGAITVAVQGDPQKLSQLQGVLKQLVGLGLREAERRKQEAASSRVVLDGVAAIVGFHLTEQIAREVEPVLIGDRLISRYKLPRFEGTAAFVPYAGIAAAVAIPALVKYLERAKSVEATVNLRRIRDAAIAWHAAHHGEGKRFAFPATTPWSPTAPCCGQPSKQCAGGAASFSSPGWKALGFSVGERHRFQYRFVSEGKGSKAHFVAEARGDLDCTGRFTLLSVAGAMGEQGELEVGEITAAGGID